MQFLRLLLTLFACLWTTGATDNGLTTAVTWDPYSLTVNDSRVFILYVSLMLFIVRSLIGVTSSAEFHYQRIPVPEMWLVRAMVPKFMNELIE